MTSQQRGFISVYLVLLAICGGLLIGSDYLSLAARDVILPIAADGFTLVLGAIVGALSAMLGATAKQQSKSGEAE